MRLLRTICVIALAVSLTAVAYAATQSVKLSGDIEARGFFRDNWAIARATEENAAIDRNYQSWAMTTAEVQLDADLTDNVAAVIRLVNERDWEVQGTSYSNQQSLAVNGAGQYAINDDEFDVGVDLAYIELREFLYSPLTLRIGRQDLWFGKGFIIGRNQRNPNNISAPEYTAYNSFDAIRATLDYDPWTIDLVYSKIYNNAIQASDDCDLLGGNVGYIFDSWNAEAEAYYWYKGMDNKSSLNTQAHNYTHCIGMRGSFDPIENWTISAEGASQFGSAILTDMQIEKRNRLAWAVDADIECRHFVDKFAWKPVVGAEYIFYSGDTKAAELNDEVARNIEPGGALERNITGTQAAVPAGTTGDWYHGWDPMFRGKFDTAYREFIGMYYQTHKYPARPRMFDSSADASYTNQHQVLFKGSVEPADDLVCLGKMAMFWLAEPIDSQQVDTTYVGTEFDLQATWDYTEDVSFGLLGAWFIPGYIYDGDHNSVTELVGSVSVDF